MKVLARDYAIIKELAAVGKWIPSDGSQGQTLHLRHQNSTVIDQERAAIERARQRQEKEVQKMIEANLARKEIEQRNAEKAMHEQQRQLMRDQADRDKQQAMQEKVRLQQQKRKAIAEAEAALVEKKRLEA